MPRKTILLLITNLNYGGAQRVFYNLSVELAKEYKVVECVFNFDSGHAFKSGNEVISLDVKAGKTMVGKIYNFYKRCAKLARIKRELHAEVCISHLEGADYVNILSRQNEKVVCCLHGSKLHDQNIEGPLGWIRKKILIPFLYKRADELVTVSKGVSNELVDHFKISANKVTFVPNFFYPAEIQEKSQHDIPSKYQSVFNKNQPVYITVGRLTRQKNQRAFVQLAASCNRIAKSKWIVLGDGELFDELIDLSKSNGLKVYSYKDQQTQPDECDIYFPGFQENPFSWISKSDWFVLTSQWEGFPMVIGEAMACHTPVISTDCQTGPREFLSDLDYPKNPISEIVPLEFGILMPLLTPNFIQTDINSLATKLVQLTATNSLHEKYKLKAPGRIQQFTVGEIMPQWKSLIEQSDD